MCFRRKPLGRVDCRGTTLKWRTWEDSNSSCEGTLELPPQQWQRTQEGWSTWEQFLRWNGQELGVCLDVAGEREGGRAPDQAPLAHNETLGESEAN